MGRLNRFLNESKYVLISDSCSILLGPRFSGKTTAALEKYIELEIDGHNPIFLQYTPLDRIGCLNPARTHFSETWADVIDKKFFLIFDDSDITFISDKIKNIDFKRSTLILDDWYYFPENTRKYIHDKCVENGTPAWIYSGSPFKFRWEILSFIRKMDSLRIYNNFYTLRDWFIANKEYRMMINDFMSTAGEIVVRTRKELPENAKELWKKLGDEKYDLDVRGAFFNRWPVYEYPSREEFKEVIEAPIEEILIESISYDKRADFTTIS